jgi:trans-2-enoyl-CoA reductase
MKSWKKVVLGFGIACSMGFGLAQAGVTAFGQGTDGLGMQCPSCGGCPWGGFHGVGNGSCICCAPQ